VVVGEEEAEAEEAVRVHRAGVGKGAIITTPMRKTEGHPEVWTCTSGLARQTRGLECAFPTLVVGIL